jgi:O-antigen/teichoic acid export membrane protein
VSLANKSLSLFSREVLFTILGLGVNVVIARTLGPVGVGLWAVLDLLNNYGRVFGGPRFEIASVYFLGQKKYGRGEIFFMSNLAAILCSAALTALALTQTGLLGRIFFRSVPVEPAALALVLSHFPLLFLKRNYHYFLLSREDTRSYNAMMVLQELINLAVVLPLLFVFKMGLTSLAIGMLAGSFLSLIYGAVKVHRIDKMVFSFNGKLLREMFRFSSKVYLSEAVGFLNNYLSNFITALLLTPTALAFFSMGKGKAEWLNRITNAVGTVLYPRVASLNGADRDPAATTTAAVRLSLFILLLGGLGLALLIYPVTRILYGAAFLPLIPCFFIVLPAVVVHNGTSVLRQHFLGIGRSDIPLKISLVPLLLQGTLCFLLIPPLGYLGGALAVTVTFAATAVITVVTYRRITQVTYREILIPGKSDFEFLFHFAKEKFFIISGRPRILRKALGLSS